MALHFSRSRGDSLLVEAEVGKSGLPSQIQGTIDPIGQEGVGQNLYFQ